MPGVLIGAAHPDDEVLGYGGTTYRQQQRDCDQTSNEFTVLEQAAQHAGEIRGDQGLELLNLPNNRLDSLYLIKQIESLITRHQFQVVYVQHADDVNVDPGRLHEAVGTEWLPTSGHLVERETLGDYSKDMRPWPHGRSLEALEHLGRWRGDQVGVEGADSFWLLGQSA